MAFGTAQRKSYLHYESTGKALNHSHPIPLKKKGIIKKGGEKYDKESLYQVGILIQSITVTILIKVQQNTLNTLFLNKAIKCVKTGITIFTMTRRLVLAFTLSL